MDLPESSSAESEQVAKAAKEQNRGKEPLVWIHKDIVRALQNPQFRNAVLRMENKIMESMQNPDLKGVELPNCCTSYLKRLAGRVAEHYGIEPPCTKSVRVFAKKKPESRIPSIVLSSIPPALAAIPKKQMSKDSKFIILKKPKQSHGASPSNLSSPEKKKTLEEREEEYYKARARIFGKEVTSGSTSPMDSGSISQVRDQLIDESGREGTSSRHAINEGSRDGTGGRYAIKNAVHNFSGNLNSNETCSRHDRDSKQSSMRPMTSREPHFVQENASNVQHQVVQYEPSIEQSQFMQYGASVSQPASLHYGANVSPYMLTPHSTYPMYYLHLPSDPLYNAAYSGYTQWYTLQPMQSLSHEPMQYQPSISNSIISIFWQQGASISQPPLGAHTASTLPSILIPWYYEYNPRDSHFYVRAPMLQFMQAHCPELLCNAITVYMDIYNCFSPGMLLTQEVVNVPYSTEQKEERMESELRDDLNAEQEGERRESKLRDGLSVEQEGERRELELGAGSNVEQEGERIESELRAGSNAEQEGERIESESGTALNAEQEGERSESELTAGLNVEEEGERRESELGAGSNVEQEGERIESELRAGLNSEQERERIESESGERSESELTADLNAEEEVERRESEIMAGLNTKQDEERSESEIMVGFNTKQEERRESEITAGLNAEQEKEITESTDRGRDGDPC